MTQEPSFVDEHLLQIGPVAFHCEHPIGGVPDGRLPVAKTRALVEAYIELNRTLRPQRIVELGVYKGGSTVLLSELSHPQKLVALELSTEPVPVLTNYLEDAHRRLTVRPYFGVNHSDNAHVTEIVEAEFGREPIDLVIDDASHLYDETLASFEVLFPLLRPGGLYLIEDWTWQHLVADGVAKVATTTQGRDLPPHIQQAFANRMQEVAEGRAPAAVVPLSHLVLELVLARASSGDIIADVTIGPFWAQLRRGPAALEAGTFRVADTFHDHFNLLSPRADEAVH